MTRTSKRGRSVSGEDPRLDGQPGRSPRQGRGIVQRRYVRHGFDTANHATKIATGQDRCARSGESMQRTWIHLFLETLDAQEEHRDTSERRDEGGEGPRVASTGRVHGRLPVFSSVSTIVVGWKVISRQLDLGQSGGSRVPGVKPLGSPPRSGGKPSRLTEYLGSAGRKDRQSDVRDLEGHAQRRKNRANLALPHPRQPQTTRRSYNSAHRHPATLGQVGSWQRCSSSMHVPWKQRSTLRRHRAACRLVASPAFHFPYVSRHLQLGNVSTCRSSSHPACSAMRSTRRGLILRTVQKLRLLMGRAAWVIGSLQNELRLSSASHGVGVECRRLSRLPVHTLSKDSRLSTTVPNLLPMADVGFRLTRFP